MERDKMLKNITLSAEKLLIEKGRAKSRSEKTTLNQKFREWLASYVSPVDLGKEFDEWVSHLDYVKIGKNFTREEMNER